MRRIHVVLLVGLVTAALALATTSSATAQSGNEKPKATEIGVTRNGDPHRGRRRRRQPVRAGPVPGRGRRREGRRRLPQQQGRWRRARGPQARRRLLSTRISTRNDSRNATITACQNDLALVGSAVLFLTSVDDIINCKDQAGQATGLPDLSSVITGVPESCSPMSFPSNGAAIDCATVTQNPQTYYGNQGPTSGCCRRTRAACTGR